MVGLHLQHEVHHCSPTIDAKIANRHTRRTSHCIDHVASLHHHALHRGACKVCARRAAGDAENGAAGIRVPPRAAEPGERRHQHDAASIRHALGKRTNLTRCIDDVEAVAQPLHGCTGHKNRTFEGVHRRLRAELPRDCGEHARSRRRTRRADIEQDKTAGAVGVLGAAWREACLTKECSLLITCHATHRHTSGNRTVGSRHADATARSTDFRQLTLVDAEHRAGVVAPAQRANVKEHRARCIGHVGGERGTTCEAMHEKRVDRGECEVPVAAHFGVAQEPLDLRT